MEMAPIIRGIQRRIIKSFLDILILMELMSRPMSGYDIISLIHKKFHLLVSSGTVYSTLYSLERNDLIKGKWTRRKRVYFLTEKGQKVIRGILNANDRIQSFLSTLLSGRI